jgi:hypothetical protein
MLINRRMCRVIMAKNITSFFLKNDLLVNRIICRYSNYGKKKTNANDYRILLIKYLELQRQKIDDYGGKTWLIIMML